MKCVAAIRPHAVERRQCTRCMRARVVSVTVACVDRLTSDALGELLDRGDEVARHVATTLYPDAKDAALCVFHASSGGGPVHLVAVFSRCACPARPYMAQWLAAKMGTSH